MKTDVRLIATALVVLFFIALCMVATGWIMLAVFPFAGMCAVSHHIERNKDYYNRQIDRICGKDDRLC